MSAAATARVAVRPRVRRLEVPGYVLGLALAEAFFAFGNPLMGLLADGVLLLALVARRATASPAAGAADALLALALVPILRLVSATIVMPEFSIALRYALVGGPLLLGAVVAARTRLEPRISLAPRSRALELAVAATGVPLGYVGYLLAGRPTPLVDDSRPAEVAVAALVLFLLVGCVEELIFRGLIQDALGSLYASAGVLASCALGGAMYLGVRPGAYALFAVVVGLGYALLTERTRSVAGVAVSHGLLVTGALLVWPLVLG